MKVKKFFIIIFIIVQALVLFFFSIDMGSHDSPAPKTLTHNQMFGSNTICNSPSSKVLAHRPVSNFDIICNNPNSSLADMVHFSLYRIGLPLSFLLRLFKWALFMIFFSFVIGPTNPGQVNGPQNQDFRIYISSSYFFQLILKLFNSKENNKNNFHVPI